MPPLSVLSLLVAVTPRGVSRVADDFTFIDQHEAEHTSDPTGPTCPVTAEEFALAIMASAIAGDDDTAAQLVTDAVSAVAEPRAIAANISPSKRRAPANIRFQVRPRPSTSGTIRPGWRILAPDGEAASPYVWFVHSFAMDEAARLTTLAYLAGIDTAISIFRGDGGEL